MFPSLIRDAEDAAYFSACRTWRYSLTRELGGDRTVVFCGCNPSVADAKKNDPTVRKDIGFATRWGFGRLIKVNANAFCATDPAAMHAAAKSGIDVVGPENDAAIHEALIVAHDTNGIFVLGCGNHISIPRLREVVTIAKLVGVPPMCFQVNQNGTPKHELYVRWSQPLVEFTLQPDLSEPAE